MTEEKLTQHDNLENGLALVIPSVLLLVGMLGLTILDSRENPAELLLLLLAVWLYPLMVFRWARIHRYRLFARYALIYQALLTVYFVVIAVQRFSDSGDHNMRAQACYLRCLNEVEQAAETGGMH